MGLSTRSLRCAVAAIAPGALAGCGGNDAPGPARDSAGQWLRSDAGAGISVAHPPGWHTFGGRLTSTTYPRAHLLLTSYATRPGGNCAPDRAQRDLPARGALIYLFEYRPQVGEVWCSGIRPRPVTRKTALPGRAKGK